MSPIWGFEGRIAQAIMQIDFEDIAFLLNRAFYDRSKAFRVQAIEQYTALTIIHELGGI
jgi:hypothetical protein